MQNLYEQQSQLYQQTLYIHDHENMENVDGKLDGNPPIPPPRKYVSIFRINGEPILPPLMTTEKRRQMQKLKEKALIIEKRLRECKQQDHDKNNQHNENIKENSNQQTIENISQRSEDSYEIRLNEAEKSMDLLKNILQKQQTESESLNIGTMSSTFETSICVHRNDSNEKLQKLQKSEILIYDNSTHEVIQVPPEKEKRIAEDYQMHLKNMECQENINNSTNRKPSHLLLVGVNSKGIAAIPSICLNPPTPLTVNKTLCDSLSGTEIQSQSFDFSHDLSSDDSFSIIITETDKKPYSKTHQHHTKLIHEAENSKNDERKPLMLEKNVYTKIEQFETMSSDSNTLQTSPGKSFKNRKIRVGSPSGSMSRSATSPSIKLCTSNRSSSSRSPSLAQESDISPESSLVRSSSFTLDGPSKALIQHMQQQKVTNNTKSDVKCTANTTRNLPKKSVSNTLRAHRDTVESKAKKVQKIEFKSSKQKNHPKTTQSKLAKAAASSISPYNTTTPTQHISKRSPFDTSKTSHTSHSNQMRKSNSTSSYLTQTKSSKSKLATSSISTSSNSNKTFQTCNEYFNNMDKKQKDKFLHLLAQQEDEQRKLQQSFEIQQKLLIEQLNHEMATSHLKSPNSYHITSTTSISLHNKYDQQKQSPPRQFNKKNSTIQHQSPPLISNNSSYISFDRNQSRNENPHQNPSYGSHYPQSPQPFALNNSHFSLINNSNANTSLDISTLSIQTSPDTSIIQNDHNTVSNKTTPSSRRRLFSSEINGVRVGGDVLRSRSAISTSYTSIMAQSFVDPGSHRTNDSNRRVPADNSFILNNAATKINAFARGFLVRRLFKTEQIQRIVQTIRDTLIFVLNLHIETIENPEESQTPANIKLKARLLQQLSSACFTLHLIFFQTSIKERMEIIARDRKRIKNKLLTLNRKR